jgi:hypothetical protein
MVLVPDSISFSVVSNDDVVSLIKLLISLTAFFIETAESCDVFDNSLKPSATTLNPLLASPAWAAFVNAFSLTFCEALFEQLLNIAQLKKEGHGFRFKNPLYSIDSTIIDLCLNLFPRAGFRKKKSGIKMTVKLDHQGKIPCFVNVTNAREHGIKGIREAPREPGDVLIFDRGYADYEYFSALCAEKVWFVTRLKSNRGGLKKGKRREGET